MNKKKRSFSHSLSHLCRTNSKVDPSIKIRQSVVNNQETTIIRTNGAPQPSTDYSNLTDAEQLYARLANNDLGSSVYNVDDNDEFTPESDDIAQLHAKLNPTDIENLYARLPKNTIHDTDDQEGLNEDE